MGGIHFITFSLKRVAVISAMWLTLLTVSSAVFSSPARQPAVATYVHKPSIAIVIDDFGQDRKGVAEMLAVPLDLTCAVMPNMEYTRQDAENAHAVGKEVIVHMPMQAHTSDPMSWYGPEPILIWHSHEQAKAIAQRAIENVPYAVGMNIHIGSKSSEKEALVTGVIEACKEANYYFLDSFTSSKSVCAKVASEQGVPFLIRHVFLENGDTCLSHIKNQLKTAAEIAQERGSCVCIGHVGPEGGKNTAAAITEMIPYFEEQGVEIVFASQLLMMEENVEVMAADSYVDIETMTE